MSLVKGLLPLGILVVARKYIDFEDPDNVFMLRSFYAGAQILVLALWAVIFLKIKQKVSLTRVVGE